MLIDELPDDCLILIFDYLFNLKDLISCYQACIRWSHLVMNRTRKVRCLLDGDTEYLVDSIDHVYYRNEEPIDRTVARTLLRNLMFVEVFSEKSKRSNFEDIIWLIKNQDSAKGLIYLGDDYEHWESLQTITKCFKQLEMLSVHFAIEEGIFQIGFSVKQFSTQAFCFDFVIAINHDFPNLERLRIDQLIVRYDGAENYTVPIMEKMKIFELKFDGHGQGIRQAFHFIDRCPNLRSVHIAAHLPRFFVDESKAHEGLQDLVLSSRTESTPDWNEFKKLLTKYPNLKHVGYRNNKNLRDEHIKQLVQTAANLVLLDVRKCPGVTQSAAVYIRDYCKRNGRSIKFYFNGNAHEIKKDWPHVSTEYEKFSRGFDFMKNCFFKNFSSISDFLVPTDY